MFVNKGMNSQNSPFFGDVKYARSARKIFKEKQMESAAINTHAVLSNMAGNLDVVVSYSKRHPVESNRKGLFSFLFPERAPALIIKAVDPSTNTKASRAIGFSHTLSDDIKVLSEKLPRRLKDTINQINATKARQEASRNLDKLG
jgi:hypothetical protein